MFFSGNYIELSKDEKNGWKKRNKQFEGRITQLIKEATDKSYNEKVK